MQTKSFLFAALFSAISVVAAEPAPRPAAPTTITPAQSSIVNDINSYVVSLTAAPEWPSYSSVIASAFESITFVYDDLIKDLVLYNLSALTSVPQFTDMPKNPQNYIISINKNAESIISKDLSGAAPRPTGALMVAGAAAAGFLGVAAML